MESTRQKKFNRLIQKELGDIFQKLGRELYEGAFITVTQAKVSPDLSICRVYLTFMLVKNPQDLLRQIKDNTKYIRQQLGNRIRHQARIIPDLIFYLDDTDEVTAKVDELFRQIEIPPEDKDYHDQDVYKEED
jgi:ribosome-binding factor A